MTKEEAIDVIHDAGLGFLSTLDGDQPRVRPMMPYLIEDEKRLILALLGNSRSISEVKKSEKVELCFVDRKMWFARVTGVGTIDNNAQDKQLLWDNVPMLKQYFGGIEDSNFVLMNIAINHIEASTPHQKAPEKINL